MSWARLDENFPEHPKVLGLKDDAFRAHVRAICYSARLLTDGVILRAALPSIGASVKIANSLVTAGVWEAADGGYVIHDYLTYNPAREEVLANRQKKAEAGALGGRRSGDSRRSKTEADASSKGASKNEADASPSLRGLLHYPPNPVPIPSPDDSLRSSSLRASDDGEEEPDDLPMPVREMRAMVLSKLGRYANDDGTFEEAELFARDYAGQVDAYNHAWQECQREGKWPFPRNLRKYMPKPPKPAPKPAEPIDWSTVPTSGRWGGA
jgi:hypothetical protein